MKYNTLSEMKQRAKAFKSAYQKAFPSIAVWIEKQSNEFVMMHNLTGTISNPLHKKQWII